MKKALLFLSVLLMLGNIARSQSCPWPIPCAPSYAATAPIGVPYMGIPSAWSCWAGPDRYLARSIFLQNLAGMVEYGECAKFKRNVDLCVELKASYLSRVAMMWGNEGGMAFNGCYHQAAQQSVKDINSAYSLAKLRIPIIEAAILEYISGNGASGVNQIEIPAAVLTLFHGSYGAQYAAEGLPWPLTGPVYFDATKIVYATMPSGAPSGFDFTHTPDISRIETMMYYYYLGTEYIAMGYQGLHMGNYTIIAYNDAIASTAYTATWDVFTLLRNYALGLGKFVYINADMQDIYYNNDNYTLIFDFNCTPIRPEESYFISSPLNYAGLPCKQPNLTTELFFRTNQFMLQSHGGLSPSGCIYDYTPTLFNVDWAGCSSPYGVPHHSGWGPYGYEETSWFYTLKPECQAYWIESVACALKNDIGHRLYLKIPGIEGVTCGSIMTYNPTYTTATGAYEFLYSNPLMKNSIKNVVWNPNRWTNFTITTNCTTDCDGKKQKQYILKTTNPDCSSVYSWHVQDPSGNWLPYTYGTSRVLDGLTAFSGMYKFYMRQDNFGYENDDYPGDLKDVQELEKDWPVGDAEDCQFTSGGDGQKPKGNNSFMNGGKSNTFSGGPVANEPTQAGKASPAAGTKTAPAANSFEIYPNPTSDKVSVVFSLQQPDVVDIYLNDAAGKKITDLVLRNSYSGGLQNLTFQLGNLIPGTYFIVLKSGQGTQSKVLTLIK